MSARETMETDLSRAAVCRFFPDRDTAYQWMLTANRARRREADILVLVDGPDDAYAVMDLPAVIELGVLPYAWAV